MLKIQNRRKLGSGPILRTAIGGVNVPLITGNVLTKPVSTVLMRPTVKPIGLYN